MKKREGEKGGVSEESSWRKKQMALAKEDRHERARRAAKD